jgi:hypothetical protein
MIFFYLGKDRETGMIVEGGFLAARTATIQGSDGEWRPDDPFMSKEERSWKTERRMREHCASWGLDLIDYDGPFTEFLWRAGLRKPKWVDQRPLNISADEWGNRLKSTDELSAYRAGKNARRK